MMKPTLDYVLIEPEDPEKMSAGGIHLPDVAKNTARYARVLAVGPGKPVERSATQLVGGFAHDPNTLFMVGVPDAPALIPMEVQVGDRVIFRRNCGQLFEHEGKQLRLICEKDIVAKVVEYDGEL